MGCMILWNRLVSIEVALVLVEHEVEPDAFIAYAVQVYEEFGMRSGCDLSNISSLKTFSALLFCKRIWSRNVTSDGSLEDDK